MSSRFYWEFFKDGAYKVTLNQHEASLAGFGGKLVEFCRKHSLNDLRQMCNGIIMADYTKPAEDYLIEKYYTKFGRMMDVGLPTCSGVRSDWRCLLSLAQSNPDAYAGDLKHMVDYGKEMRTNVHECNYTIIMDLDAGRFKILKWDYGHFSGLIDFDITAIPDDWDMQASEMQ